MKVQIARRAVWAGRTAAILAAAAMWFGCGSYDDGGYGGGPGSFGGGSGSGTGTGPCIVGTWVTTTCGGSGRQYYVFNSSGTGYSQNDECNGICEPMVFRYDYELDGSTCTLNYTSADPVYCEGYGTNTPMTPKPDTFTFTCSGDELVINGTYPVTFTRTSGTSGGGGGNTGTGETGGGGGGGDGYGRAIFWTASATLGGSYIDVVFDGASIGSITHYRSSAPECGTSGYANVTTEPGTYSYTATGEDGTTWTGSITLQAGGCSRMELQ